MNTPPTPLSAERVPACEVVQAHPDDEQLGDLGAAVEAGDRLLPTISSGVSSSPSPDGVGLELVVPSPADVVSSRGTGRARRRRRRAGGRATVRAVTTADGRPGTRASLHPLHPGASRRPAAGLAGSRRSPLTPLRSGHGNGAGADGAGARIRERGDRDERPGRAVHRGVRAPSCAASPTGRGRWRARYRGGSPYRHCPAHPAAMSAAQLRAVAADGARPTAVHRRRCARSWTPSISSSACSSDPRPDRRVELDLGPAGGGRRRLRPSRRHRRAGRDRPRPALRPLRPARNRRPPRRPRGRRRSSSPGPTRRGPGPGAARRSAASGRRGCAAGCRARCRRRVVEDPPTRSRPGLRARTGSSSSSTRSSSRSAMRCADSIVSRALVVASVSSRTVPLRSLSVRGSWESASVCVCRRSSRSLRPGMRGTPSPRKGSTLQPRPTPSSTSS